MLEKAGFMQMNRAVTIDENGYPTRSVEVVIEGRRYGIIIDELREAIRGMVSARIFRLRVNWKQYVSTTAGIIYLSRSGKALNFEFTDGSRYTVSLDSLKSLITKRSSYAPIGRLPLSSALSMHPPVVSPLRSVFQAVAQV